MKNKNNFDVNLTRFTDRQQELVEINIENRFDLALENGNRLKDAWNYALSFDFDHYIDQLPNMVCIERVQDPRFRELLTLEYGMHYQNAGMFVALKHYKKQVEELDAEYGPTNQYNLETKRNYMDKLVRAIEAERVKIARLIELGLTNSN